MVLAAELLSDSSAAVPLTDGLAVTAAATEAAAAPVPFGGASVFMLAWELDPLLLLLLLLLPL